MLSFGSENSAHVAIVTGAGRGLGRAWAQALASRGVRVVVNDNDADHSLVEDVVQSIRSRGGVAVGDHHSVTDGAEIVKTAMDNFKRVNILINVWTTDTFWEIADMSDGTFVEFAVHVERYGYPRWILPQDDEGKLVRTTER